MMSKKQENSMQESQSETTQAVAGNAYDPVQDAYNGHMQRTIEELRELNVGSDIIDDDWNSIKREMMAASMEKVEQREALKKKLLKSETKIKMMEAFAPTIDNLLDFSEKSPFLQRVIDQDPDYIMQIWRHPIWRYALMIEETELIPKMEVFIRFATPEETGVDGTSWDDRKLFNDLEAVGLYFPEYDKIKVEEKYIYISQTRTTEDNRVSTEYRKYTFNAACEFIAGDRVNENIYYSIISSLDPSLRKHDDTPLTAENRHNRKNNL